MGLGVDGTGVDGGRVAVGREVDEDVVDCLGAVPVPLAPQPVRTARVKASNGMIDLAGLVLHVMVRCSRQGRSTPGKGGFRTPVLPRNTVLP